MFASYARIAAEEGKQMSLLTIQQTAALLQTSHDTVYRLVRSGKLSAERLTARSPYRVSEESLQKYADANNIVLKTQAEPQQSQ